MPLEAKGWHQLTLRCVDGWGTALPARLDPADEPADSRFRPSKKKGCSPADWSDGSM